MFLRARNANEVLRAQTAKLRLQKLAGDLVDRTKATGLVFELARRERDSWMNWPPRVAANMAALEMRRLPVVDRDKRLVGIVSLANFAHSRDPAASQELLRGVARPH